MFSSGILTYRKQAEPSSEVRGHLHMLGASLRSFSDMTVNIASTPILRRDGPEGKNLMQNRFSTISMTFFHTHLDCIIFSSVEKANSACFRLRNHFGT